MTITDKAANLCMDAMAFSLTKTLLAVNPEMALDPVELAQQVETIIRDHFVQFCEMAGIDDIKETAEIPLGMFEDVSDDEPDFPDDVDETNYDPYMGCDFFETCDYDEGW